MADYPIIADVSNYLVKMLREKMCPEPIPSPNNIEVSSPSSQDVDYILGLYLYDIREEGEISLPTLANMVEGGRSPYLTAGELQAAGYSAVYFPVAPLYAAAKGVYGLLRSIRDSGSAKAFSDAGAMLSFEEFNAFIGLDGIRRIESGDFGGLEEKSNGHF